MEEDPEYTSALAQLAAEIFGKLPAVTKLYSENNYVCRLDFGRRRMLKILKVAGAPHLAASVRQEGVALRRLRDSGLAVPAVEREGTFRELPFLVLEYVGPGDLGTAISQRLDWATAGCARAGRFLRQLHTLPISVVDGFVPQHVPVLTGLSWRHRTLVEAWNAADDSVKAALATVEARLNSTLGEPGQAVIHDSFVATHVLTDGDSAFAVNDWETIRVGPPERDLACFGASLKTWLGGDAGQERAFMDGYTRGTPLDAEVRRRVADWEVYYLMNWAAFSARHGRVEMAEGLMQAITQSVGAGR